MPSVGLILTTYEVLSKLTACGLDQP